MMMNRASAMKMAATWTTRVRLSAAAAKTNGACWVESVTVAAERSVAAPSTRARARSTQRRKENREESEGVMVAAQDVEVIRSWDRVALRLPLFEPSPPADGGEGQKRGGCKPVPRTGATDYRPPPPPPAPPPPLVETPGVPGRTARGLV